MNQNDVAGSQTDDFEMPTKKFRKRIKKIISRKSLSDVTKAELVIDSYIDEKRRENLLRERRLPGGSKILLGAGVEKQQKQSIKQPPSQESDSDSIFELDSDNNSENKPGVFKPQKTVDNLKHHRVNNPKQNDFTYNDNMDHIDHVDNMESDNDNTDNDDSDDNDDNANNTHNNKNTNNNNRNINNNNHHNKHRDIVRPTRTNGLNTNQEAPITPSIAAKNLVDNCKANRISLPPTSQRQLKLVTKHMTHFLFKEFTIQIS